MRVPRAVFIALAVLQAAPVAAGPTVRGTMHAWRANDRTVNAMLSGRAAFDEAAMRAALQAYAADAGRIAVAIDSRAAPARDIKRRFIAFQSDSQRALGDVARRDALRSDVARIASDCQSCHDAYKN